MSAAGLGTRPVLVTGGAGFIGCNLVDRLVREGEHVLVFDSLARPGVESNLAWLRERHPRHVSSAVADIRDAAAVQAAVSGAKAVFHLAAQVAVTTSMTDPAEDFAINLQGTFNVLQALRARRQPCVFASTNKVYGKLDGIELALQDDVWQPTQARHRRGVEEAQPLDFCTPYGCSKGAADQYVLDWSDSFGVPTAVMRMSCIYGPHQFGTEDQGWVAHFLLQALAGEPITLYGDGRQVRDVLWVEDAVSAYVAAWRAMDRVAGQAFNLGGGPENAISLRQLLHQIATLTERTPHVRYGEWRPNDQRWFVSDTTKVRTTLGLPAPRDWRAGVADLARFFVANGRAANRGVSGTAGERVAAA